MNLMATFSTCSPFSRSVVDQNCLTSWFSDSYEINPKLYGKKRNSLWYVDLFEMYIVLMIFENSNLKFSNSHPVTNIHVAFTVKPFENESHGFK